MLVYGISLGGLPTPGDFPASDGGSDPGWFQDRVVAVVN